MASAPARKDFQLRTIGRSKLYTAIVDQIVAGIRSGAFPPGTALPPERVLAEKLSVSRGSVREAIRVLEHAGVLDVRSGSGTYVTEVDPSEAVMLRAHAALIGEHSPLDLMVARRAVEPICAAHAAAQRHEHDLDLLRDALEKHATLLDEGEHPADADWLFHLAVAKAARSPVLLLLVELLVQIMQQQTWRELQRQEGDMCLAQHRSILHAIESRNPEAAERAMQVHLDGAQRALLLSLE